jgi:hypothetical protein
MSSQRAGKSMTLDDLERIDFNDAYVQAKIAAAATEARDYEPTLLGPEIQYYSALADIEAADFSTDEFGNDEVFTAGCRNMQL